MRGRAARRGYVLAGGQSSRMGIDKADILFAGVTMLENAIATMAEVCDDVTVVGSRSEIPLGATCIPDVYSGCGPMGGIAAALRDCRQHAAEFAVFLPVDMPLLPSGLLRSLTEFWGMFDTMRVAVAIADGRVQPLVSVIHVDVGATLDAALARGDHKLQPALRMAAETFAETLLVSVESVFLPTSLEFGDRVVLTETGMELSWSPTTKEWDRRFDWFANLNTRAELQDALTRVKSDVGSGSAGG